MLPVVVLAVAVLGVFVHPRRLGAWGIPSACAVVSVLSGAVDAHALGALGGSLAAPLGFLLCAVPVAVLLDRLGFFEAAASLVDGGRHLHLGLWALAAVVTTVLNLDASVVLLTPLYLRVARRHGIPPLHLAVQPVLLAACASSALPVSNLTNLIVAERLSWSAGRFAAALGAPSLAATVVGYLAYRRWLGPVSAGERDETVVDRRPLWRGAPVAVLLVAGFTAGDVAGIPPVAVAAVALVWLLALVEDRRHLPVPLEAAVLAAALAVCATAAVPHLPIERLVPSGDGPAVAIASVALGVATACAVNNLPALLVLLPLLPADGPVAPGVLLGLNIGPALVLSGALAGLLWRSTAARLGEPVSARAYTAIGLRVGLPALVAAAVVHAALSHG